MTRYAIGLGSNLGDRLRHLIDAHDELEGHYDVTAVSSIYETVPVGGPDQGPYLNALVLVETDDEPLQVLEVCQEIESRHGRERKIRWGARTLDLDIVAADMPYRDDRLSIPHTRAAERRFVLRPLSDVWPQAEVSEGLTASQAQTKVEDHAVDRLASDWIPPVSRWRSAALLTGQFSLLLAVAVALAYDGTLPDGEVTVVRAVGGVMAFIGIILAFVASRRLGVPTASPIPRPGAELVMSGPYRFARHPIYGGLSLFMMGTALVLDSLVGLAVAAALIPYFFLKASYEEHQLRMRFSGYLRYKQTVHRWLIPFVV